jgi:hypothetical protein
MAREIELSSACPGTRNVMPNRHASKRSCFRFVFRFLLSRLGAAGLALFWLTGCVGLGPPRPDVGYRANVTIKMSDPKDGPATLERVVEFYQQGKRRRTARVDGQPVALIDRPDLRVSWRLNPEAKSFDELELSSAKAVIEAAPDPFGPRTSVLFQWVGTESVDDVDAEKYQVTGERFNGYAWLTPDRIPMRFSGVLGAPTSQIQLEVTYSEIEKGSQALFLFSIPPNYAGYEKRKQKRDYSGAEVEVGLRRLMDDVRGRPSLPRLF